MHFEFLKLELGMMNWRKFVQSDNPVAAALLAKMKYTKKERTEVRLAYLCMVLNLRRKLNPAQLALMMSVADMYFVPSAEEDRQLLRQLVEQYSEEGEEVMELMPAWKRWGYEEGIAKGIEQGIEQGMAQGKKTALLELLEERGPVPGDVQQRIEQEKDAAKLSQWIKLSVKASSMDDFVEKM